MNLAVFCPLPFKLARLVLHVAGRGGSVNVRRGPGDGKPPGPFLQEVHFIALLNLKNSLVGEQSAACLRYFHSNTISTSGWGKKMRERAKIVKEISCVRITQIETCPHPMLPLADKKKGRTKY